MTTVKQLQQKLAKLEAGTTANVVTFTMPDWTIRKMRAKRVIDVCHEAILGSRSQEVETILQSIGNNASHRLVELLKMCIECC